MPHLKPKALAAPSLYAEKSFNPAPEDPKEDELKIIKKISRSKFSVYLA